MPRSALVYDAHDYVAGASTCRCAEDHAPCAECGAADGSYVHSEEAKDKNFVLVQHVAVEVVDEATGGDAAEA